MPAEIGASARYESPSKDRGRAFLSALLGAWTVIMPEVLRQEQGLAAIKGLPGRRRGMDDYPWLSAIFSNILTSPTQSVKIASMFRLSSAVLSTNTWSVDSRPSSAFQ